MFSPIFNSISPLSFLSHLPPIKSSIFLFINWCDYFSIIIFSWLCSITLTCLLFVKSFSKIWSTMSKFWSQMSPIYRSEMWWSCSCCLLREGSVNIAQIVRIKLGRFSGLFLRFLCGVLEIRIKEWYEDFWGEMFCVYSRMNIWGWSGCGELCEPTFATTGALAWQVNQN